MPVCWEPRERVSKEATERKLVIAASGLATSHSPSEGRVHPNVSKRRGDTVKMEKPLVRPWCVRPEQDFSNAEWEKLFRNWQRKQYAEDVIPTLDPIACAAALRSEVAM